MCILGLLAAMLGVSQEFFSPGLQDGSAPTLGLFLPAGQAGEKVAHSLPYQGLRPQAQVVPGGFLPHPTPYRLIGIEVRAVAWQIDQSQAQAGRPEIFPHRLAPVGISIDYTFQVKAKLPQLKKPRKAGKKGKKS